MIEVNYNQYKETIAENIELIQKNHSLKERINKAIKYIEKFVPVDNDTILMTERQRDYLISILKENTK